MKWVRSGDYDRIMAGEYVKRGTKADARDEAADADRLLRRQVPDDLQGGRRPASRKAGDKATDAADKLSEWLRQRVGRRHRLGEVVALRDVAVQRAQGVGLRWRPRRPRRRPSRRARARAEMTAAMIARSSPRSSDAVDERLVDLDHVDRQQVLEVRRARSSRRRSRRSPAARRAPSGAAGRRARPPGPP